MIKVLRLFQLFLIIDYENFPIAHHYITFASSDRWYVSGAWSAVEHDGFLDPWNEEMCAFIADLFKDASESVEYHGPVSSINCQRTWER